MNAELGIVLTFSPIVRLVRLEQPSKTGYVEVPIDVQFSALNTTDVNPLQLLNAEPPIEVTELGKDTDVSPLQPENASSPIEVTELPIVTEVSPLQPENA